MEADLIAFLGIYINLIDSPVVFPPPLTFRPTFGQRILVQYCISIPVHVPFPIRRFRQQIHQLLALLCLLSVGRNARIPICSYERRNIRFVRKYERRQDPRTCPDYCNDTSIVDTVFNVDTRFRMQSKWALCIRQWVGTVVLLVEGVAFSK